MAQDIGEHTIIARKAGSVFREQEGVMYLMERSSARCLTLNPTGTAIWSYLDQPMSLGQIADHLTHTFEVDRHRALDDSITFAALLESRRLLQINS